MKPYTISPGFTETEWMDRIQQRPTKILSSNSKLSADGIWNLTMPALEASVVIGGKLTKMTTCPTAGTCKAICYASQGGYIFSSSMIKHTQNLQYMLDDPFSFLDQLNKEIRSKVKHIKRFRAIRFNDSGDFFGPIYWNVAKQVMLDNPTVTFYCYTKRVAFFKSIANELPSNFHVVFSMGGTEDHLIDTENDRHAKVFHTRQALRDAGYSDGMRTDRLAASGKYKKIALVVHGNHKAMPKFRKMVAKINKVAPKSLSAVA